MRKPTIKTPLISTLPRTVDAAFDETAQRYPDRTAVIRNSEQLTYAQLAARADAIASWLVARGIGPGATVGLFAQRSSHAIAAILGILKTGAAYLPLDPGYPRKLLQYIYEDCKPAALFTSMRRTTALLSAAAVAAVDFLFTSSPWRSPPLAICPVATITPAIAFLPRNPFPCLSGNPLS